MVMKNRRGHCPAKAARIRSDLAVWQPQFLHEAIAQAFNELWLVAMPFGEIEDTIALGFIQQQHRVQDVVFVLTYRTIDNSRVAKKMKKALG